MDTSAESMDDYISPDLSNINIPAFQQRKRPDVNAAKQIAANPQFQELAEIKNTSVRPYDAWVYSLSWKQSGCYTKGSLPVPLAKNNTCHHGWYCE